MQEQQKVSHPNILPLSSTEGLIDNYNRRINYLRLAITDRCNLRCRYCRPEKGMPFIPHKEILSLEEIERLVSIFCSLGVNKIRITGGEPFTKRGCLPFLKRLKQLKGIKHLHITTNGVKTSKYLNELEAIGLSGINISLDTLDRKRFWTITRRDYLEAVLQTITGVLERDIPLKINSVVLEDTSDAEIIQLAKLAKNYPITLRFIERMPFSGTTRLKKLENPNLAKRLHRILSSLNEETTSCPTTSRIFSIPGYVGKIGIIQGYSRSFCKTCNKVRITPVGVLKTCLYDNGALDLKMLLRKGANDKKIRESIIATVQNSFINGHIAENVSHQTSETSMAKIGG